MILEFDFYAGCVGTVFIAHLMPRPNGLGPQIRQEEAFGRRTDERWDSVCLSESIPWSEASAGVASATAEWGGRRNCTVVCRMNRTVIPDPPT